MGQRPMREAMPITAAWIDDLRFEFGHEDVTAWIRQGIKDGAFRATEGGQTVGEWRDDWWVFNREKGNG